MKNRSSAGKADLQAGDRLGRYEIISHLATGGMAELYLARATGLEGFARKVVVKRIRPSWAEDERFVAMFLDEARLAANLHHPNIVQVFDIGRHEGQYFFAMEYVRGADLRFVTRQCAAKGIAMPLNLAIHMLLGVAAALHHAHELAGPDGVPLHLAHRDVSPSNVLVGYDGGVKVVDFGIAKATTRTSETSTGKVRGKISYMSPEQCRAESLDRRTDIFSLGILAFELTTLTRLFDSESDVGALTRILFDEYPTPSSRCEDYPPALEAIVMKALARDREDRYQTADEFYVALEEFAHECGLMASTRRLAKFMGDLFGERARTGTNTEHLEGDPGPPPRAEHAEQEREDVEVLVTSGHLMAAGETVSAPSAPALAAPVPGGPSQGTGTRGRPVQQFAIAGGLAALAILAGVLLVWGIVAQSARAPTPEPSALEAAGSGSAAPSPVTTEDIVIETETKTETETELGHEPEAPEPIDQAAVVEERVGSASGVSDSAAAVDPAAVTDGEFGGESQTSNEKSPVRHRQAGVASVGSVE